MSLAQSLKDCKIEYFAGHPVPPNLLLSVYGGEQQQEAARRLLLGPPRELNFGGAIFAHVWTEVCPGHFATHTLINRITVGRPLADDLRRVGVTDFLLHEQVPTD